MNHHPYKEYFGFSRLPFGQDIHIKDILKTKALLEVAERFNYAISLGAMAVVTGEVGSGKSTALRWAFSQLHSSEYKIIFITASSGSILELYRYLCWELEMEERGGSRTIMVQKIRRLIREITEAKKQRVVLIIDEASLLRLEVFTELHILTQFDADSKPLLPIILAGQNNLYDNLVYRTSIPLSSRIVARSHLEGVDREQMEEYLIHHLKISGVNKNLFAQQAITAIHQGSGGLFRRANNLARGALIAAASEECQTVSAEHVRITSTELIGRKEV